MNNLLRPLLTIALLATAASNVHAQQPAQGEEGFPCDSINPARIVVSCSSLGGAFTNVLNSYMSPYDFKGWAIGYTDEQWSKYTVKRHKIAYQTFFTGTLGRETFSSNAQYLVQFDKSWRGLMEFPVTSSLSFYGGVAGEGAFGILYLPSNSNNHITGKCHAGLFVTGMALYHFKVRSHSYVARYQVEMPLAGVMFAPDYGQSYYEIFGQGHFSNTLEFFTLTRMPSLRHHLSLDIPFRLGHWRSAARVAWVGDFYQTRVKGIKTHTYSQLFTIGLVKTLYKIKPHDKLYEQSPY